MRLAAGKLLVRRSSCECSQRHRKPTTRGTEGNLGKAKHTSTAGRFWKNSNCKAIPRVEERIPLERNVRFFSN